MIQDKRKYKILIIEDNVGDLALIEEFIFEQMIMPEITTVVTFNDARSLLTGGENYDAVLLDLTLSDNSGEQLVTEMLALCGNQPVIILTGFTDIEFSIRSISKGVMDYLLKDDLNAITLYKSIVYSIERKMGVTRLLASEKRYSDLFHFSPQPMCLYDSKTFFLTEINKAAIDHYGYNEDEFRQMTLFELVPQDERGMVTAYIRSQERELNKTYSGTFRNCKKTGEIIEVETFSTPLLTDGRALTLVICVDVTEKNLYEHRITKAIIKTQDDERYEIGGELHDNVCQILAAGLMSLSMLKKVIPVAEMKWFEGVSNNITMATDEIRNLSHRLAPAFFDDSTLEQAFRVLLESFDVEQKYAVSLNVGRDLGGKDIGLDLQLNLYRILQEQLKNIYKYAGATRIEVDVFAYNGRLKMRICDNGRGFDMRTAKKGIGLANMKRRAELFEGSFLVETAPDEGCAVIVDMPLR